MLARTDALLVGIYRVLVSIHRKQFKNNPPDLADFTDLDVMEIVADFAAVKQADKIALDKLTEKK